MLTVFGSIIVDSIFSVPSLPREGETVLADDLFIGPGGKGANQAVAAAKAGGKVAMVGSVGSDATARICLDAFEAAGVDTSGIAVREGPTGSAAVQVAANGANQISVAPAANRMTQAAQITEARWQETSTLVMQMEIPFGEIEAAIFEASRRGVRSILNLAPAAPLGLEALKALDILIANEVELEMLAGILGTRGDSHVAMAQEAAAALGHAVVVTLGGDGAALARGHDGDDKTFIAPALDITPVDTTGAGDAFCGVFAASLDAGDTLEDALRRGCIGGSLACLKTGAQESQPRAEEIGQHCSPVERTPDEHSSTP